MSPLQIVFLLLFGIASLVHLVLCFFHQNLGRQITKCFPMVFLIVFAIVSVPQYYLIWLGAIFGLLGDFFLIFRKTKAKFLVVGTIAFLAGHICYLIQIISLLTYNIQWYVFLICGILLVVLDIALYPFTRRFAPRVSLGFNFYLPFLIMITFSAILLMINSSQAIGAILLTIGYLLFFISDTILIYTSFLKKVSRHHFYIMATYLPAELLIVLGFVLFIV